MCNTQSKRCKQQEKPHFINRQLSNFVFEVAPKSCGTSLNFCNCSASKRSPRPKDWKISLQASLDFVFIKPLKNNNLGFLGCYLCFVSFFVVFIDIPGVRSVFSGLSYGFARFEEGPFVGRILKSSTSKTAKNDKNNQRNFKVCYTLKGCQSKFTVNTGRTAR